MKPIKSVAKAFVDRGKGRIFYLTKLLLLAILLVAAVSIQLRRG